MKPGSVIAGLIGIVVTLLVASKCLRAPEPIATTLEKTRYTRLTSSEEILHFLDTLSRRNPRHATTSIIGTSAKGKPIGALLLSENPDRCNQGRASQSRLLVMLVGSQHGSEPSGAEALLLLAREILEGELQRYVSVMDFLIVPDSNPDGRTANRRVNGNGVNLSTDFAVLSEPESRALVDALYRWQPQVLLDVHESAVLKKKSLGQEGFLTDFEAQFEAANNPNVDSDIRTFSYGTLLPDIVAAVSAHGLPCQRYIGEITSINQVITHGGLSVRNLRNRAGMAGCFSFLLENRLDASSGSYSTPRNIRDRVRKQSLCLREFLRCIAAHEKQIAARSAAARSREGRPAEEQVCRSFFYQSDPRQPYIDLPLRKRDTGERVMHRFTYRGLVGSADALPMPKAYLIRAHYDLMSEFLSRHHLASTVGTEGAAASVIGYQIEHRVRGESGADLRLASLPERPARYILQEGDIIIPTDQPAGKLVPLLLDLRSVSCIFFDPQFSGLVEVQGDFFICRVPQ